MVAELSVLEYHKKLKSQKTDGGQRLTKGQIVMFLIAAGVWVYVVYTLAQFEETPTVSDSLQEDPDEAEPIDPDDDAVVVFPGAGGVVPVAEGRDHMAATFPEGAVIIRTGEGEVVFEERDSDSSFCTVVSSVIPASYLGCKETVLALDPNSDVFVMDEGVIESMNKPLKTSFFSAVHDFNACRNLTEADAKTYFCQRGITNDAEFRFALRYYSFKALEETTLDKSVIWQKCLVNIAYEHFHKPAKRFLYLFKRNGELGGGRDVDIDPQMCSR